MKKARLICLFLILCTLISLSSCNNTPVLSVTCITFPEMKKIKAAEINNDMGLELDTRYQKYNDYYCFVAEEKGKLILTCKENQEEHSRFMAMNYGYFLGSEYGEYGGLCKYYPYGETEGELVSSSCCTGLFSINYDLGYMISSDWVMSTSGHSALYRLSRGEGPNWSYDVIANFDSYTLCYLLSEDKSTLYVATFKQLLKINLEDGNVTVLHSPEYWVHLGPYSIVELEGSLYLGMTVGVYEYELETGKTAWYPIEYEKYVSSGE